MKYKWKVQEALTGRYKSFEKRGFPEAWYENGDIAALMSSESDYDPRDVKLGEYKPITLRIADHSIKPWKWRKITGEYKTIQDAKDAFERILIKHPEISPKEEDKSLDKLTKKS